jgi:hypothetical protein
VKGGTLPGREGFPVGVEGMVTVLSGSEGGDVYRALIRQSDE